MNSKKDPFFGRVSSEKLRKHAMTRNKLLLACHGVSLTRRDRKKKGSFFRIRYVALFKAIRIYIYMCVCVCVCVCVL